MLSSIKILEDSRPATKLWENECFPLVPIKFATENCRKTRHGFGALDGVEASSLVTLVPSVSDPLSSLSKL